MDERSYLRKLLKKRCHNLVFTLMLLTSCIGNKEESNEINIKVYASTVSGVPVLLRIDEDVLVDKELKPNREMYERVKVLTKLNDSVTVFYKEGDRDTTFTYMGAGKVSYFSILYSKWWDKFFLLNEDSAAFYTGGDDVVYYD